MNSVAIQARKTPEALREVDLALKRHKEGWEELRRLRQQTIRELVEEGWSQTELARELGVTRTRIYQMLTEFSDERLPLHFAEERREASRVGRAS